MHPKYKIQLDFEDSIKKKNVKYFINNFLHPLHVRMIIWGYSGLSEMYH